MEEWKRERMEEGEGGRMEEGKDGRREGITPTITPTAMDRDNLVLFCYCDIPQQHSTIAATAYNKLILRTKRYTNDPFRMSIQRE